jgi:acyl carrier protein
MTDSRATVHDRVIHMLSELLLLRPEEIRPESLLLRDLDVDSIALLELTFCIEKEFGVDFPDLKASAETFGMPLPEALRTLEETPGVTTFFEYVKEAVVRRMLAEAGAVEVLTERLGLTRAAGSHATGRADRALADAPEDTVTLLGREGRDEAFRQETVAGLARSVGGDVPPGIDPATPLASLRLSALFDFLTVRALVGYVEHLLRTRRSRAA